jgi:hypothetical protein
VSAPLVAIPIRERMRNTGTINAITHVSGQFPLVVDEFPRAV